MAYREVDPGPAPENDEFFNFKAIGDKFVGRYQRKEEVTNNFGKEQTRYHFKTKDGPIAIDANYDLKRRLEAASLIAGVTKCMITFTGIAPNKDPGKSGMKLFKLLVDDTPPTAAAAPPPPPPPAADDIDF